MALRYKATERETCIRETREPRKELENRSSRADGRGRGSWKELAGNPGRAQGYLIVPRARGESLRCLQAP